MIINSIKKDYNYVLMLVLSSFLLVSDAVISYKITVINHQSAVLENIVMTEHLRDAEAALDILISLKENFREIKDVRIINRLSEIKASLKRQNILLSKKELFPEISFRYILFNKSNRSMLYINTAMLESINSVWLLYSITISAITNNSNKFGTNKINSIKLAVKYGKAYKKKLKTLNNRIAANTRRVEIDAEKYTKMTSKMFYILLVFVFVVVLLRKKGPVRIKSGLNKRKVNDIVGHKKKPRHSTLIKNKKHKSNARESSRQDIDTDESIAKGFVEDAISDLKKLPSLLKQNNKSQSELREVLAYICRTIHKIKGDAAILRFEEVVELIHILEDKFIPLQNKASLSKSDFINFKPIINEISGSLKKINAAMKYIDRKYHKSNDESVHQFFQRLQLYTNEMSKENNKSVRLIDEGFTQKDIPKSLRKDILSIVVQLLRNAVIHGIEAPEKRKSAKKPQSGSIHIGLQKQAGSFTITVRDDGAGLDLRKIKRIAVKSGKHTHSQIDEYTNTQLVKLILQPGFSTANKVDKHAGRGVGLNLVDTIVNDLGGKLSISMRPGVYTEFSMTFPS